MSHRRPLPAWYIFGPVLTVGAMLAGRVLLAQGRTTDLEHPNLIRDTTDLRDWFVWQQDLFLPFFPTGHASFPRHGTQRALPFDPGGLPSEVRVNMPGTIKYDCPVYRIYLREDPDSRAMVIENRNQEVIYSLPASIGYHPFAFVEKTFPDLYSKDPTEMGRLLTMYDPARLRIALDLVPEDFFGSYLSAQTLASEPLVAMMGGGLARMSEGSCTQIHVSAIGLSDGLINAVEVTVCLPAGFTNKVDLFALDEDSAPCGGADSVWLAVATGLQPASGTNTLVWTNTPLNDTVHNFYTAGSDLDEDGDGLSSASETLVFNSFPSLIDTDLDGCVDGYDGLISTNDYPGGVDLNGDGYVDGEAENRTDPTSIDTTAPTVTIVWPPDGVEWVWVP